MRSRRATLYRTIFFVRTSFFDSVPALLDQVSKYFRGDATVLGRGQHDANWGLTPRLARTTFRRQTDRELVEIENDLLSEFDRLSVPYLSRRGIQSLWDKLALAQHHGLPTKLLDWTTNPLVAAWFAVESAASGTDAAVWAYDVRESDIAFYCGLLKRGRSTSSRLSAPFAYASDSMALASAYLQWWIREEGEDA
jgi:hypothetical protein